MSIRILLADDHTIVRSSLSRCLQTQDDMQVVAETGDGASTVRLAKQLQPDVIVMDIAMPNLNGIDATREIARALPSTKIVALSMHLAGRFAMEMFKAGAYAYIPKDCGVKELLAAIRTVAAGRKYLSPAVKYVSLDAAGCRLNAFTVLTPRERQVLQHLAEGLTTRQIAQKLKISAKTVETHRLNITRKLGIDNVAQLTRYAIQEGLTTTDPDT